VAEVEVGYAEVDLQPVINGIAVFGLIISVTLGFIFVLLLALLWRE